MRTASLLPTDLDGFYDGPLDDPSRAQSPGGLSGPYQWPSSSRGSESPSAKAVRERAIDYWKVGDSMRIMHHIEPKKHRSISLFGDAYQGFFNHDWKSVEHIKALRGKCPANRMTLDPVTTPYPQGMSQEDINRNRNFAPSHGAPKITGGLCRSGALVLVP